MRMYLLVITTCALLLALSHSIQAEEEGGEWADPITGMEFVWVPGGCFEMGCGNWTSHCFEDEYPAHEVCVDGFWLGKHEVTQGQWQQVMGFNPSYFALGNDYPVESVSWNEAAAFVAAFSDLGEAGYRLPSEAEWEYACRSGGQPEMFAGAGEVDELAWHHGNSERSTHPVGTKAPNSLGLYDMSGNVWEFCQDWYAADAYLTGIIPDPEVWSMRAARGGSFGGDGSTLRCAVRNRFRPDNTYSYLGLRLVRVP